MIKYHEIEFIKRALNIAHYSPGAAKQSLKWQACLYGLTLLAKRSRIFEARSCDRPSESDLHLFDQKELAESPKRDREKLKSDSSFLQSSSFQVEVALNPQAVNLMTAVPRRGDRAIIIFL
jgi:hypothetical protein